MSVEKFPVEDLHSELQRVAPGSPEEEAILEEARARREQKTNEFRVVRNAGLEQTAENGIVDPTAAQQITKIAIKKTASSQEIPVEVVNHSGKMS